MIAETLSVGTELLLGQIVDTDAAYLSQILSALGFAVYYRGTVGDNPDRIREAIRLALTRCDVLITCGGLGPTMDDLTKEAVCGVLGVPLAEDPVELRKLEELVVRHGFQAPRSFYNQAMIPQAPEGRALPNSNGTAPGILVEKNGKAVICLPGPPNELIPMVEKSVVPYLAQVVGDQRTVIKSRVLKIIGLGESQVEEMTRDLLLSDNPTVAPLAKTGECQLRITARAAGDEEAEALIAPKEHALRARLGDAIYGVDDQTLEEAVVKLLTAGRMTIATAESCTGGLLSQRVTSVPGASEVFGTGVVSYANSAKSALLGVPDSTIATHGAVSPETAAAMAEGVRLAAQATLGVAITGIAGPSGGSPDKPVGLVYVALAAEGHPTRVTRHYFGGKRGEVNARAASSALAQVRTMLLRT